MKLEEAARAVVEAWDRPDTDTCRVADAIDVLRAALAAPKVAPSLPTCQACGKMMWPCRPEKNGPYFYACMCELYSVKPGEPLLPKKRDK